MTENTPNNNGATAVRKTHRLDEPRLIAWLEANVPDFAGLLRIRQFEGGQSNPTYKLTTPTRSYVLRRQPPGHLLPGAHAVDREARVQKALGSADFPVARILGLCTDNAVIGSWFYLMEFVEGRIFWNILIPEVTRAERAQYFDAMNATIAKLHTVEYAAIGLGDYGRPGNYFERQIGRWAKQYRGDTEAGRDANMDSVIEWLSARIPANDQTSIVHGDFRIDNMIFHPSEPRVVAVLDWELSTLGHPLADFAYHLMMYRMAPNLRASLVGANLNEHNIPQEDDYVAAYCRRTARESIPELDYYVVFGMFRLAAILHGIKARLIRGTAASAHAATHAASFAPLAEYAWQQAQTARL
jgi:aminoglycoside phosphotransferase (APT) family kinase protein